MEKEKYNSEKLWLSKYPLLKDDYTSNELFQTMSEKLSRVSQDYWDTINKESKSGEEISEKFIYEAHLSDIEKRFDKNSIEYKIFQALKKQGLRIFINPKTDVSYTDKYNIIRWLGPITEQSRYTMELWNDTADDEVYMTKLIHEMWHSLTTYLNPEMNTLFKHIWNLRSQGFLPTKLWNLDRYETIDDKATEDTVEFVRMYIQNPEKFKMYLKKILGSNNTMAQEYYYNRTKEFVDAVLNKLESEKE